MRVGIVYAGIWLAGCAAQAVCQTDGGPSYLAFFQRVVTDKASPGGAANRHTRPHSPGVHGVDGP
jgi:hypothetical protein